MIELLNPQTVVQACASAFALAGAFLLRKPGRFAPWGFATWLVSNPAAMVFMAMNGHWFFFAQHLVFLIFAAESVWHWLLKPAVRERAADPECGRRCRCGAYRKYVNES